MVTRLKSSKNREDNSMDSGMFRTALTNGLHLELDYLEPREVSSDARSRQWALNSEECFARIQALIADDFKAC
jgi:hypothetical protein